MPACGCVVHGVVPVHIDFERGHAGLQQHPDDLVVALVGGPVERCVAAHERSVHGLFEGIWRRHVDVVDACVCVVGACLSGRQLRVLLDIALGHFAGAGLDEQTDDADVTAVGGPHERAPFALVLAHHVHLLAQQLLRGLVVAGLTRFEEGRFHFLGERGGGLPWGRSALLPPRSSPRPPGLPARLRAAARPSAPFKYFFII